jgi:polar amino acid transport system permease protein
MASNVTTAAPEVEPPILRQIRAAQQAARASFRFKFVLTWAVILGVVGIAIVVTGNADPEFTGKWTLYILGGTGLTILISVVSIILATILAVIGAMGRLSGNGYVNGAASLYVSLVRGTPLLVQIYFVFFALPQIGIVLDPIPAGIVALAFNYGAYMTEIFRAGIQAVPRGQREAAEALGMPERQIMRRIVLPQAIRIVIPAIGNDFVSMIKDSSLVSVVGLQEILWRANTVGRSNSQLIQALLIAALVYWALTIFFSTFQARLERRLALSDVRV